MRPQRNGSLHTSPPSPHLGRGLPLSKQDCSTLAPLAFGVRQVSVGGPCPGCYRVVNSLPDLSPPESNGAILQDVTIRNASRYCQKPPTRPTQPWLRTQDLKNPKVPRAPSCHLCGHPAHSAGTGIFPEHHLKERQTRGLGHQPTPGAGTPDTAPQSLMGPSDGPENAEDLNMAVNKGEARDTEREAEGKVEVGRLQFWLASLAMSTCGLTSWAYMSPSIKWM